jgi:hypothetical protein
VVVTHSGCTEIQEYEISNESIRECLDLFSYAKQSFRGGSWVDRSPNQEEDILIRFTEGNDPSATLPKDRYSIPIAV